MNKQYEITFLTKEDLKEKPVLKEIEALDGKIISTSTIGQKQLSYKIQKEKEAYFTTVVFEINPEKITELNRKFNLKDEILRHLIVIFKKKGTPLKVTKKEEATITQEPEVGPRPISPGLKEKKIAEVEVEKEVETEKVEKEIKAPKKVQIPATKPKKVEKPEIELGEEERLKALNEKLDELLKE